METAEKIIRLPNVEKITGLPRSTIYEKISLETFPKPIKIGTRSVGWINSEIQGWIKERINESRKQ